MDYKAIVLELKDKGIIIGDDITGYKLNPYLEMPKSLSFDEVSMTQGLNRCNSRLDADTTSEVARGVFLKSPFLAANMSTVVSADFCNKLYHLGALGVLHRAWKNEQDYLKEVKKIADNCGIVAASVGAGKDQVSLASRLIEAGATMIVIDIAHGYSPDVINTAARIRKGFPKVKIIVGNTINPDMMYEVEPYCDAVKTSIGTGSACETKDMTGCYEKNYSIVSKFKDVSKKLGLPIISDGGFSKPEQVAKAIAAGANSVMLGRVYARCPESAAELVGDKKLYAGMASREVQKQWRGGLKPGTCPEGKSVLIPLGEPVAAVIERYTGALRSSITYVGATNIEEFQDKARFVRL